MQKLALLLLHLNLIAGLMFFSASEKTVPQLLLNSSKKSEVYFSIQGDTIPGTIKKKKISNKRKKPLLSKSKSEKAVNNDSSTRIKSAVDVDDPVDEDGDGEYSDTDCDDGDPTVNSDADEICGDGIDNNCDGDVDDVATDDEEICGDGIDNNCDGGIDDVGLQTFNYDGDGDGYGDDNNAVEACQAPPGYIEGGGDCDDSDPNVHMGAAEVCDGIDNNCNGQVDEGFEAQSEVCNGVDDDCNGSVDEGFENVAEICNGIDDNCNGQVDEGFENFSEVCNQVDDNCNGSIDEGLENVQEVCDGIDNNCNGAVDEGFTNVQEVCDQVDNNCNGQVDEGFQFFIERCNGVDDNCNGQTDEGFDKIEEVLDGLDNNCNGQIDEGLKDGEDEEPECCPPFVCAGGKFDPYTGNVHRKIKDLEVWGAVGEAPFVWMRYSNSRKGKYASFYGNAHNWNSSFQFWMSDIDTTPKKGKIIIHYPEGGSNVFVQNSANLKLWLPMAGVSKRLSQTVDTFFLQMENGYKYRFEKLKISGRTCYRLKDYRDAQLNLYKLDYLQDTLLSRVTEPAGRYLSITYSTIGGMKVINKVTSSDGRSVTYAYTVLNDGVKSWVRLVKVVYGDATQASYTYIQSKPGVRPLLDRAIDPRLEGADVDMKFIYDTVRGDGFIKQELNGTNSTVIATLNADSINRYVCYPNGRVQTYVMPTGQLGELNTYIDGLGRETKYSYDNGGSGFLRSWTDALGRITKFDSLTIYGNPIQITLPDGSKKKWTRNTFDLILTSTDELGRITKFSRDASNRVTRIDYPNKTFETFTYNSFGQVLAHTLKNKGIETNQYDSRGLRVSYKDALGNITLFSYDQFDRLQKVTDARGNTTSYEYNERGLVTKVTYGDGTFQTYAYNRNGDQISLTDELGHVWSTTYDEFKRPTIKTDPLARKTLFSYAPVVGGCGCSHFEPKPTKITLPSGMVTEIEYDVEWYKIRETVAKGKADQATTFYEYDVAGNLINVFDPKGNKWRSEFDSRNRKTGLTDPLGKRTEWSYDVVGNVKTMKRPDKAVTQYFYDAMNQDTLIVDTKNQKTKIKYDVQGNVIALTDPKNNVHSFQYDLIDRKVKMTFPGGTYLGKYESYAYDSVGNLKADTTLAGRVRTYAYDKRSRLINSKWSDATPEVSLTYDAAGRLLIINSSVSKLTYTYNNANETVNEIQAVTGAPSRTIRYSYVKDGLRDSITYPDGSIVKYTYSGRNQVVSIAVNKVVVSKYTYDLNSNRLSKTLSNGTSTTYAYDNANRLLQLFNKKGTSTLSSFEYGYDNLDRRSFVKRETGKGDVFSYDSTNQLTAVQYDATNPNTVPASPLRVVNYSLDAVGNRMSVIDNGISKAYSINNRNQYYRIANVPLTYDANGNLSNLNGWNFIYDAQNRLIQATKLDSTISFAYDPFNRCVKRTLAKGVNIVSGVFLYYDGWSLIDERITNGAQITQYIRYVHGARIDEILFKTTLNKSIYHQHDGLGNVVQLTDTLGTVVEKYSYDVFGKATIRNSAGTVLPSSAFGNRFMFTGREYLNEIKLYDYRNRIYSDSLGRFLQIDPIRFQAEDLNLYRYVRNNSVNNVDNFGLETEADKDIKRIDYESQKGGARISGDLLSLVDYFFDLGEEAYDALKAWAEEDTDYLVDKAKACLFRKIKDEWTKTTDIVAKEIAIQARKKPKPKPKPE